MTSTTSYQLADSVVCDVQVHQGTVDSYLESILSETIHATAKKQAVSFLLSLITCVCI
jgi:hypothetical protein